MVTKMLINSRAKLFDGANRYFIQVINFVMTKNLFYKHWITKETFTGENNVENLDGYKVIFIEA
jgi:hypothetical protein